MRIITGKRKGLKLDAPKGDTTRPTESRIKESLFNILGNVEDSRVCDLFAGSGAIGIEFLSRGAKNVVFVENDKVVLKTLKNNLNKANLPGSRILNEDYNKALKILSNEKEEFDYIYIDPPYFMENIYETTLNKVYNSSIFDNSLIIVEAEKNVQIENLKLFEIIDEREYRNTVLYFIRRKVS